MQNNSQINFLKDKLLSNKGAFAGKSITQLSRDYSVSPATISRFVREIGFRNYKAFQSSISIKKQNKNSSIQVDEAFNRVIIHKIMIARRVLIFAQGSSKPIAEEFTKELNYVGVPAVFMSDIQPIIFTMAGIKNSDTIIVFSESAQNKETKFILERISNKKSNNFLIGGDKEYKNWERYPIQFEVDEFRMLPKKWIVAQMSFVEEVLGRIFKITGAEDLRIISRVVLKQWNK